jgi:hypothetical protein
MACNRDLQGKQASAGVGKHLGDRQEAFVHPILIEKGLGRLMD